jgi:uncharacterized membrane protein
LKIINDQQKMKTKHRLFPLDFLRGLLIVLMALDHANYHIAQQHSSGEYWGGYFPVFDSPIHFLTRFVTHLCAPGFFFLMGIGMILFQSSRRNDGWNEVEIRWHFLSRGLILIGLQVALNFGRIWSTSGSSSPLWYVGVLSALGAGMIFSIPLLNAKPIYLGAVAVGFLILMEVMTPDPLIWGRNFDQLAGVLLVFGGGGENFWVNYPLLAWIELIVCGMLFGRILLKGGNDSYQWGAISGLVLIVGFIVVRSMNSFGTIRPLAKDTWMEFLSVVKYPPSLAFVFLTMGINLLLLWYISLIKPGGASRWNPLLVFGRAPLFSYVVHILIYLVLGRWFFSQGTSLGVMYLVWLGGLIIMYLPARWYGNFRSAQPSRSWIRMF